MLGSVLNLLKKIPIDLAQGSVAETTEGKQIALKLVPDGEGRRALDLGCREGNQTRWLRGRGYDVVSIDVEKVFEDAQVVDANAPLPFANDHFDLVWSSEVIEHLEDPRATIEELRRITKPGGEIILTTPNSYMWLFRAIAKIGLTPERIQRSDHLHFFDVDDIERVAPDAELMGYFPYLGPKKTLLGRAMIGLLSPTFVLHIRVD